MVFMICSSAVLQCLGCVCHVSMQERLQWSIRTCAKHRVSIAVPPVHHMNPHIIAVSNVCMLLKRLRYTQGSGSTDMKH